MQKILKASRENFTPYLYEKLIQLAVNFLLEVM